MNRLSPFVQKIIYICLIVALLVPLSFIARPASQRGDGGQGDTGGRLAMLRWQYNMSQAKLGEIDPASETMKLMSLGFRSVAATSLWLNAIDAQVKKDWDQVATALNTLMRIQPNFHKVWDHQAHNLSYNISVEFDDYEQRYSWVKKGLLLLRKGLSYNQRDHRFTDTLGKYSGQKIGRSDEKVEFRQLFRYDDDYHASLDDIFDRDSYDAGQYGKDNWLLAYQWFNRSMAMVEQGVAGEKAPMRTKELMFYMNRPAQLRNHVSSLQREFPPEESFKFKWQSAHDEWNEYGAREIRTSSNLRISLDGMEQTEMSMRKWREELDVFAPGVRAKLLAEIDNQISVSPEERRLINLDIETLSEDEKLKARLAMARIEMANKTVDESVLQAVKSADRLVADELYLKIKQAYFRLHVIELDRSTINYQYWKDRTFLEMSDEALVAHQSFYDAHDKYRAAIYDDFVAFDKQQLHPMLDSNGVARIERGAIASFIAGFQFWADVSKNYPSLGSSAFFDIMLEDAGRVREMVDALGRPWPKDFPFQAFIDANPSVAASYRLPNSESLKLDAQSGALPMRPSLEVNVDSSNPVDSSESQN